MVMKKIKIQVVTKIVCTIIILIINLNCYMFASTTNSDITCDSIDFELMLLLRNR